MDQIVDWLGQRGCEALNAVGITDFWGCAAFHERLGWGMFVTAALVVLYLIFRSLARSIG